MDHKLPFAELAPEDQAAALEAMEDLYIDALVAVGSPYVDYDSPEWAVVQNFERAWQEARRLYASRVQANRS